MASEMVSVRYIVSDVGASVAWYTEHLGFSVFLQNPAFADIRRGSLRLLLAGPNSSAGKPMPNGEVPAPGGWNRIHLVIEDIASEVQRLSAAGVRLRGEILTSPHGSQVLLVDPSGNLVELFESAQPARQ